MKDGAGLGDAYGATVDPVKGLGLGKDKTCHRHAHIDLSFRTAATGG